MNRMLLAAACALVALPAAAQAADPAPVATPAPAASPAPQAAERVRCRTVRTTNSRIPERICRTEAQWAEIEQQSREALERNRRGAGASGDSTQR